jgi:hypothetical protein
MRCVDSFELDITVDKGVPGGFISFATFSHKTAAQVARHGLPLPLVAPIWGLDAPPWGLTWKNVAQEAEVSFSEHFRGPILAAPLKSGKWGLRSVSSREATKWLHALLSKLEDPGDQVTSHSLKCTTSWLAKAGANGEHSLVLGHHSSGKGSLEVFSRDLLAAPLRTLEGALRQVRVGSLQPDRTRSGIIQQPDKEDCRNAASGDTHHDQKTKAPAAQDEESSSSSSSSDSSTDDEESDDESQAEHWTQMASDLSHRQSWRSSTMYQHLVSKVVHLVADPVSKQFQCGIHASAEHAAEVSQTALLETRKCKRCQRAIGEI